MEHKEDKPIVKDLLEGFLEESHSQGEKIKREIDSIDDFEHLGHDTSPLGDIAKNIHETNIKKHTESPTREILGVIDNKGVENFPTATASKLADEFTSFDPFSKIESKLGSLPVVDQPIFDNRKMDSNLLEMGDNISTKNVTEEKMDKYLDELTAFTTSPKLADLTPEKELKKDDYKTTLQNFMDFEREGMMLSQPIKPSNVLPKDKNLLDRYSDSEDDFKPTTDEEFVRKNDNASPIIHHTSSNIKTEAFQDVEEDDEGDYKPEKYDVFEPKPFKVPEPFKAPEIVKVQEPLTPDTTEPYKPSFDDLCEIKKSEPVKPVVIKPPTEIIKPSAEIKSPEPIVEIKKKDEPEKMVDIKPKKIETKSTREVIGAEAIFCKMGLDAWFKPERLNPKVESLIYWRDPKKSGPVFGGVLVVLLALTYFSLISVVAYVSLLALTGTISFRIYKNVVQAVQKTGDGHPFKQFLETDFSLPQEKVKEIGDIAVAHLNAVVRELRRLFLVEDLVDSIKFGVLLWCLTYLGAWFNGMTLIIIGWVALFTLPKVYETNKTQIDANLDIVRSKLAEITNKVKAAVPIGKKPEEKKEQ